ncbi:MAG: methyl-accepting chemotaxis protein [Rhizonema sp. NSF051]|nr:methyl-accepting chemotaxis protein [Rhizonema sp. NSF051]
MLTKRIKTIQRSSGFQNDYSDNDVIFWIRWASLHTKALVLAFTIGTLPVVAIGTLTYNFVNQSTRKEIIKYKQDKATLFVDNINSFILRRYDKIQRLSQLKFIRNPKLKEVVNREEIQIFLNDNLEPKSSYESISIFDINGELISSSKKESIPSQKKQEYFQAVLKTDKPYISQPFTTKSPDDGEIYLVAPVKDIVTGKTIYILRTVIPVKSLARAVDIPQINQDNYDLIDASGKIFLSGTARHEGLDARKEIPEWRQIQAENQVTSSRFINKSDNTEELVTYVPLPTVEDLPSLNWKLVLSTHTAAALLTQQQLWLLLQIGVLVTALFVNGSAAILANRLIQPISAATMAVKKLGEGNLDTRIPIKGSDEFAVLGSHINQMADNLQDRLQKKIEESEQLKVLTNTLLLMNSSLNYEDLFDITVTQARQGLKADRVIIYQLNPRGGGQVIAEGAVPGLPIALKDTIEDLIDAEDVAAYRKGRVLVTNNIHEAGFEPKQVLLIERLQIKASLIIPILNDQQLFGFLIAHYCFLPHIWQIHEINFLRQLATQLGMTLKRDDLLKQTKKEHLAAEVVYQQQRQHNKQIQEQLLQLLNDIEGVSRGDLTVHAEVPVGAIGTVADFLNSTVENLREIVTSVKLAATHVDIAVSENLGEFPQLVIKALKQADHISLTLNSVDQMTLSIQKVAKSATQAAAIASTASWAAETGGKAMDMTVTNILSLRETISQTTKQIQRFGESSQQISRVVALVNEIAIQTNLLAINASVEASRAGEEAQGFAMIAEQVAILATETIAATFEMELILSGIQLENKELVKTMELGTLQVVEGSHHIQDTKESLNQIFDFCHQINELMQSISTRTVCQVQTSNEFTTLMKETIKVSEMTNNASYKVFTCLQKTVEISQELHASVSTFKID